MITNRQLFLSHVAQTTGFPLMLEIERAEGIYMYQTNGKQLIDLIAGISVSNLGHCHPAVIEAVKKQVEKYMHLMVYGEFVQTPQVEFAKLLTQQLPENLNCVYFVNSGSEATEAAMKLAKRYTNRSEIVAFKNAYHGSTQGSLSIMGSETYTQNYRPLLPDIKILDFNCEEQLNLITKKTACVFIEPIQGEAGVVLPENNFLHKLSEKCTETGALLIFDEIQTGFGRTGNLFAFQGFEVVPDILTIAKGMGGGMPIGAVVSSKSILDAFTENPILGHITTFGGHPVSCAAALANLQTLLNEKLIDSVESKGQLFKNLLKHPKIKSIRGKGLFLSVELENFETIQKFIHKAIENGIFTDWFLFAENRFRIAPPLIITEEQIREVCKRILKTIDN